MKYKIKREFTEGILCSTAKDSLQTFKRSLLTLKTLMLVAKSPFWFGHKLLGSRNKMADGYHSGIGFSINVKTT